MFNRASAAVGCANTVSISFSLSASCSALAFARGRRLRSRQLRLVHNADANTDMKNLNRRTFTCGERGHVEGRDRNAARNVYRYDEERRNRVCEDTTCGADR
jgi:hypothetical protein